MTGRIAATRRSLVCVCGPQRNVDVTITRPLFELGQDEDRLPGLGGYRGSAKCDTLVAGALAGGSICSLRVCRSVFHRLAVHLRYRGPARKTPAVVAVWLRLGFRTNDIVTSIAGHSVHTPEQLGEAMRQLPARPRYRYVTCRTWQHSRTPSWQRPMISFSRVWVPRRCKLKRGIPYRAQGTLGHYVVFAEILMQLGCMAWALLLVSGPRATSGTPIRHSICRHNHGLDVDSNPGRRGRTGDRLHTGLATPQQGLGALGLDRNAGCDCCRRNPMDSTHPAFERWTARRVAPIFEC